MASSPSSPTFRGDDGQVGDQAEDEWLEPIDGHDPDTADQDSENEEYNNMQGIDQEDDYEQALDGGFTDQDEMDDDFNNTEGSDERDPYEQTLDNTLPGQADPDLDAEIPLDGESDAGEGIDDGALDTSVGDEGENKVPTAADVRGWDHIQTAQHLRQIGVDPRHCDIFEEQEITGDVLLDMDQEAIFSHNFDLGVMGKRLKTSHKILQFQEDLQPGPISKEVVEETQPADEGLLEKKNFKHPFTWRQEMAEKFQIQETSHVLPMEMVEDLEPKWVDQDPDFWDDLYAADREQDDGGGGLPTHEEAKARLKSSRDTPGGVERATSSMCAKYLDTFNKLRNLDKYRIR